MTVCVMCGCELKCTIGDVCEACLHDMNEESYDFTSAWHAAERLTTVGAGRERYWQKSGFRWTSYVDDDGVMREARQRLCAWPS